MLKEEGLVKLEPWLKFVVKSGSSILHWIKNPRDTNYIFYTSLVTVIPEWNEFNTIDWGNCYLELITN